MPAENVSNLDTFENQRNPSAQQSPFIKSREILWISRLWKGIYKQLCGALRQQQKCDIILAGVAIRLAVIPFHLKG